MKKALYLSAFVTILASSACNTEEKHTHPEHEELKTEMEQLKKKLMATEDQLLNVRTELSKYKSADSTKMQAAATSE